MLPFLFIDCLVFFFLMIRRPPRSTRTDTLFPYTTPFRSFGSGEVDLALPAGDPGLFGPDSAAWRVHRDFNAMMIGGVSALLLQMLHPGVLAGVWDHSNFRSDMLGRLRRKIGRAHV